jgi:hypothetical protein
MNATLARVVMSVFIAGVAVVEPGSAGSSATTASPDQLTPAVGALRVLVVGDSLTAQSEPEARALVSSMGNPVALTFRAVPGSGLLTGFDWIPELERLVTDFNPQMIIAEFVGNYFPPYLHESNERSITPGSPAFYQAWAARTREAMAVMTRQGATVFWVLGPDMRDPTLDDIRHGVDAIYRSQKQQWPSTQFVDGYAALSPHGYVDSLPGSDGPETVRRADGVHLTAAGAQRLVRSVASAVLAQKTITRADSQPPTRRISRERVPF